MDVTILSVFLRPILTVASVWNTGQTGDIFYSGVYSIIFYSFRFFSITIEIRCFCSNDKLSFQVILSEKAAEAGGMMDMDDCKTDEDMSKKMQKLDVMILNDANDNVPLQVSINYRKYIVTI